SQGALPEKSSFFPPNQANLTTAKPGIANLTNQTITHPVLTTPPVINATETVKGETPPTQDKIAAKVNNNSAIVTDRPVNNTPSPASKSPPKLPNFRTCSISADSSCPVEPANFNNLNTTPSKTDQEKVFDNSTIPNPQPTFKSTTLPTPETDNSY
ncbi:8021_t:CDS:1, partial [Ambispora gerdemannii]